MLLATIGVLVETEQERWLEGTELIWPVALYQRSPELFHEWLWVHNIGRFLGDDPLEVVEQYGADALRYTVVSGMAVGTDVILDPEDLETSFAPGRNFANKLWNASRFLLMNLEAFTGPYLQAMSGVDPTLSGVDRLAEVIAQLEGTPLPASVLERDVLPGLAHNERGQAERPGRERLDAGEEIGDVGAGGEEDPLEEGDLQREAGLVGELHVGDRALREIEEPRQLRRLGIDSGRPPTAAEWDAVLAVVAGTYREADQDRGRADEPQAHEQQPARTTGRRWRHALDHRARGARPGQHSEWNRKRLHAGDSDRIAGAQHGSAPGCALWLSSFEHHSS